MIQDILNHGSSTHIVNQLIENIIEHNKPLLSAYIDYEKLGFIEQKTVLN